MTRNQIKKVLLGHPWFSALPDVLADLIIDKSAQRDVAPDALIYATGDESTGQFAVLSGEVRLVANTADGKNILYRVLKPGGWFGHLSVLDQQPRFQDAVAVGTTRLLHLPTAGFNAIVAQEPRFILNFSHLICRDIREAMGMLAEMKATPLPRRLAQALLQASGDAPTAESTESRMTQEALAAMMGTSRQTINRVLRRWEQERLIDIEYGRVSVCDPVTLAAVGQAEPHDVVRKPLLQESPRIVR